MGISEEEEEEERFLQMVRDFIESEPSLPPYSAPLHHNPPLLSLQKILGVVSVAETRVLEKIHLYLKDDVGKTKNVKEFVVMKLKMDNYEASLCKTSWISSFGRPSVFKFTGDYEYIDIVMDNEIGTFGKAKQAQRQIVDMDFRSQFELARPTPNYSELTNALPSIFVGSEEKLNKIISLLCSAAKQSLKERGLHVPPWRKESYMQSKWLSENCKKVSVSLVGRENGTTNCGSSKFCKWASAFVKP